MTALTPAERVIAEFFEAEITTQEERAAIEVLARHIVDAVRPHIASELLDMSRAASQMARDHVSALVRGRRGE